MKKPSSHHKSFPCVIEVAHKLQCKQRHHYQFVNPGLFDQTSSWQKRVSNLAMASSACRSLPPTAKTACLWRLISPHARVAALTMGTAAAVDATGSILVPTASSNCLMNSFCPVVNWNCFLTGVAIEDRIDGTADTATAQARKRKAVLFFIG